MNNAQKTYTVFAKLLETKNITPYRVYKETGVPQSSLSEWKRGNSMPKIDKLIKIAEYFGVSVDYLLTGEESPKTEKAPTLNKKDERDIARDLEAFINDMNSGDLMFDGDPMTPEAKESIIAAMKLGLEAAKVKNKDRFTPKKFKKD